MLIFQEFLLHLIPLERFIISSHLISKYLLFFSFKYCCMFFSLDFYFISCLISSFSGFNPLATRFHLCYCLLYTFDYFPFYDLLLLVLCFHFAASSLSTFHLYLLRLILFYSTLSIAVSQ